MKPTANKKGQPSSTDPKSKRTKSKSERAQKATTIATSKVPIKVSSDLLYDSMRRLTRKQLDAMPLVCQRFRTLQLQAGKKLPQCRVVEEFKWSGDKIFIVFVEKPRCPGDFPYPRVLWRHRPLCDDYDWWSPYEYDYTLEFTTRAFAKFFRSAHIRALTSEIHGGLLRADHCGKFTAIWGHNSLELMSPQPTWTLRSGRAFGKCSSLHLGPKFGTVTWTGQRRFGSPGSWTLGVRKISFSPPLWGVTLDDIINYLFHTADLTPGYDDESRAEPRILEIADLLYPEDDWPNYSPLHLKKLIQERIDSTPHTRYNFKLRLEIQMPKGDKGDQTDRELLLLPLSTSSSPEASTTTTMATVSDVSATRRYCSYKFSINLINSASRIYSYVVEVECE